METLLYFQLLLQQQVAVVVEKHQVHQLLTDDLVDQVVELVEVLQQVQQEVEIHLLHLRHKEITVAHLVVQEIVQHQVAVVVEQVLLVQVVVQE